MYDYSFYSDVVENLKNFGYDLMKAATPNAYYLIIHNGTLKDHYYHKAIFVKKGSYDHMSHYMMMAFCDDLLHKYDGYHVVKKDTLIDIKRIKYLMSYLYIQTNDLIKHCLELKNEYHNDRREFLQLLCSQYYYFNESFVLSRLDDINLDLIMEDKCKKKRKLFK